ncbi:MAG: peptidoglycan D,D-transpeptidase FtsI family protein [Candidatus Saccharibacteria bacterium]
MGPAAETDIHVVRRTRIVYVVLALVFGLFVARAFYLQVIRYSYYRKAALSDQLKEYEIPAERGTISAHMGDSTVAVVLNEKLYTIFADPTLIKAKDVDKISASLTQYLGGNASDYKKQITTKDTRYVVLAKKVSKDAKTKLFALKYPGIASEEQEYRTYPDGQLASQVLGFVNNSDQGVYGIEQALNSKLQGTSGQLKAVTDINGVPLAANTGNILKSPVAGSDVTLTIDVGMQKQLEDILKKGAQSSKSQTASALILDPNTGAVKAMANYPTYNPTNYGDVSDSSVFNNAAVSAPMEVGSIMKTLTTSAAIDSGAVQPNQTYYDPASWTVDGFKITNIEQDGGAGTKSLGDILNLSLNTGATWELMQMGGGKLDEQARDKWYDYMTNHFQLGKATGIEQGYEADGYIPKPTDNGAGIDLTYANTAFGQAMTATAVQMGAALSSVLNGGTYYQPTLIDSYTTPDGKTVKNQPKVVKSNVVKPSTTEALIPLMEYVVQKHTFPRKFDQNTYAVGGKTGTAQIAQPGGGYYDNEFNGTYMGFVGGDKVQYVIVVFTYMPHVASYAYAGTAAAQPIFGDLAHMLIDDFGVTPKTH